MASSLETALTFVLALNVILWFGQLAIVNINPNATNFFNDKGSLISGFDSGNNTYTLDDSDPAKYLPSGESSVSVTTGNIFTDAFTSIKNWFLETTGLSYVFNMLGAPYHMMQFMGLPREVVFGIGTLWYALTLFLVLSFFWGGR